MHAQNYLHVYIYIYTCMDGCMDVWMYGFMDVWMYGCMDVCMYVCMLWRGVQCVPKHTGSFQLQNLVTLVLKDKVQKYPNSPKLEGKGWCWPQQMFQSLSPINQRVPTFQAKPMALAAAFSPGSWNVALSHQVLQMADVSVCSIWTHERTQSNGMLETQTCRQGCSWNSHVCMYVCMYVLYYTVLYCIV